MKELLPLLEQLMQAWKKDLVIMADDVEWEALTTIILNKLKWVLNVLALKAPGFWDSKKAMMKDIAILTWANIITAELWMKLENITIEDLWGAKKIISSKDRTTIVWGKWKTSDIDARVWEIKQNIQNTDSKYEQEKLSERLAKLDGWVAVIKVWAASEVEMKEKKLRIEDALNATRAATLEWVVSWWWVALLKASTSLNGIDFWNQDQNLWGEIVGKALSYPIKQIAENAGKEWSVVINKVIENPDINFWYDAANDIFVDMISSWIIDPKKVERVALEEAISLAGMFLTTEAAITTIPGKDDWHSHPPMWWMPWMWGMWWMPMM
jgi:chaperonin GroEL